MVDQDVGIGGGSVLCIWSWGFRVWSGFVLGREWSGKKVSERCGGNGARKTSLWSLFITELPHGFEEEVDKLVMDLYTTERK